MNKNDLEYYDSNKSKFERKSVYSSFGWFLVTFIGMSAMPTRIEFYDKETGKLAASFTDDETRKKYVGRY
ncbi:MAG: hypothetical protein QY331_03980 [Melioribacteraceae bacterium]|jgi:hypothetical protein|nr:hypothetical protein [Melioribacteraceae bacterium]WKZ70416.1 MAG: hypothetical protein QY331_03980 [Melioribacteraceae bacterium]